MCVCAGTYIYYIHTNSSVIHSLIYNNTHTHAGFLLTILYWSPILNDPNISAAYQNFLITIEMLFAAVLLRFAFPYGPYMELRKDRLGRGVPVKRVADNFRNTLNPGVCVVCVCVCSVCVWWISDPKSNLSVCILTRSLTKDVHIHIIQQRTRTHMHARTNTQVT